MKTLILALFLSGIVFANAEEVWTVTEDTLPDLRRLSMDGFGREPTKEDYERVDTILRGQRYAITQSDARLTLTIRRTDTEDEPKVYILKKETGGIWGGRIHGSTQPTLFMMPLSSGEMLLWYGSPKQQFKIQKKEN
jgi:hypothetical protein